MSVADQIHNLREQADVGLRCVVVGTEVLAPWFARLLEGIQVVRVEAIHVVPARATAGVHSWEALLPEEIVEEPLEGVSVLEGRPSTTGSATEGRVFFDLADVLDPPLPSAGVLVVGEPGCRLLAYLLTTRMSTDSATDAMYQLFSFFIETQKREERLALRLDELHKAYHDVERRLAETFFTHEFFKALTVYEPLHHVASMIVDGTLGIMGAASCALYIIDVGSGGSLNLYASQGQGQEFYPDNLPSDIDWIDRNLKDSEGHFTSLIRAEVFDALVPKAQGLGAVLFRKDDLLGLMMVVSEDIAYGPLDLDRFASVASMASLSLQNVLLHEEIEKRAITDQLTGLYNHRYFQQALDQEFVRAKTARSHFSVIMIDLDYFKELNDTYGHLLGDMFLRRVGEAIRSTMRESDIPSRYGGDEFALILPGTALAGAKVVADKIYVSVKLISLEVPKGHVTGRTVSAGVAMLAPDCRTPKELFDRADQALYVAKENGRSQVRVFGDTGPA